VILHPIFLLLSVSQFYFLICKFREKSALEAMLLTDCKVMITITNSQFFPHDGSKPLTSPLYAM
jgi:hypothetical protein